MGNHVQNYWYDSFVIIVFNYEKGVIIVFKIEGATVLSTWTPAQRHVIGKLPTPVNTAT